MNPEEKPSIARMRSIFDSDDSDDESESIADNINAILKATSPGPLEEALSGAADVPDSSSPAEDNLRNECQNTLNVSSKESKVEYINSPTFEQDQQESDSSCSISSVGSVHNDLEISSKLTNLFDGEEVNSSSLSDSSVTNDEANTAENMSPVLENAPVPTLSCHEYNLESSKLSEGDNSHIDEKKSKFDEENISEDGKHYDSSLCEENLSNLSIKDFHKSVEQNISNLSADDSSNSSDEDSTKLSKEVEIQQEFKSVSACNQEYSKNNFETTHDDISNDTNNSETFINLDDRKIQEIPETPVMETHNSEINESEEGQSSEVQYSTKFSPLGSNNDNTLKSLLDNEKLNLEETVKDHMNISDSEISTAVVSQCSSEQLPEIVSLSQNDVEMFDLSQPSPKEKSVEMVDKHCIDSSMDTEPHDLQSESERVTENVSASVDDDQVFNSENVSTDADARGSDVNESHINKDTITNLTGTNTNSSLAFTSNSSSSNEDDLVIDESNSSKCQDVLGFRSGNFGNKKVLVEDIFTDSDDPDIIEPPKKKKSEMFPIISDFEGTVILSKGSTANIQKKKTGKPKHRQQTHNLSELVSVFEKGWRREVVYSKTNFARADVYYFSPKGHKLRSRVEIDNYLKTHHILDTELSSFSFTEEPLGVEAKYETVRYATVRASNVDAPNRRSPVQSAATSERMLGNAKIKENLTAKSVPQFSGNVLTSHRKIAPKPHKFSAKPLEQAAPTSNEFTPTSNKKPSVISKKSALHSFRKDVTYNPYLPQATLTYTTSSLNSSDLSNVQHLSILTPLVVGENKEKTYHCTANCSKAVGRVPSLQCINCLCLFHHECCFLPENTVNLISAAHAKFLCPNCYSSKSEQPYSMSFDMPRHKDPFSFLISDEEDEGIGSDSSDILAPMYEVQMKPSIPANLQICQQMSDPYIILPPTTPAGGGSIAHQEGSYAPTGQPTVLSTFIPTHILPPLNLQPLNDEKIPIIQESPPIKRTPPPPKKDMFEELSNGYAILKRIFSYLDLPDLLVMAQVCIMWKDLAYNPNFWNTVRLRNVCIRDWPKMVKFLKERRTKHLDMRKMVFKPLHTFPDKPTASKTVSQIENQTDGEKSCAELDEKNDNNSKENTIPDIMANVEDVDETVAQNSDSAAFDDTTDMLSPTEDNSMAEVAEQIVEMHEDRSQNASKLQADKSDLKDGCDSPKMEIESERLLNTAENKATSENLAVPSDCQLVDSETVAVAGNKRKLEEKLQTDNSNIDNPASDDGCDSPKMEIDSESTLSTAENKAKSEDLAVPTGWPSIASGTVVVAGNKRKLEDCEMEGRVKGRKFNDDQLDSSINFLNEHDYYVASYESEQGQCVDIREEVVCTDSDSHIEPVCEVPDERSTHRSASPSPKQMLIKPSPKSFCDKQTQFGSQTFQQPMPTDQGENLEWHHIFEEISKLDCLEQITLGNVDSAHLEILLFYCRKLQSLSVSNISSRHGGLPCFDPSYLMPVNTLRELRFICSKPYVFKTNFNFIKLPELRILILKGLRLEDVGWPYLGTSLTHLHLSPIDNFTKSNWENLSNMTELVHLELESCLDDTPLCAMLPRMTSIRKLGLYDWHVGQKLGSILKRLHNIESLYIIPAKEDMDDGKGLYAGRVLALVQSMRSLREFEWGVQPSVFAESQEGKIFLRDLKEDQTPRAISVESLEGFIKQRKPNTRVQVKCAFVSKFRNGGSNTVLNCRPFTS